MQKLRENPRDDKRRKIPRMQRLQLRNPPQPNYRNTGDVWRMNKIIRKELKKRGIDKNNHTHNPNITKTKEIFVDNHFIGIKTKRKEKP